MYALFNRFLFVLVLTFSSLVCAFDVYSASPTISAIDDVATDVNTPIRVFFMVDDADTELSALTLSATSSDHGILADIPDAGFTGGDAFPDVRLKPVFNSSGSTTVTITVSDGENQSSESFVLTVGQDGSAAPTISEIDNVTTDVNTPVRVYFSVSDADTDVNTLTLSATSSDQSILKNIADSGFTGGGAFPDVRLKPVFNSSGSTTVTITVSDGEQQSSESFVLTVGQEGSATPTISNIDNVTTDVNTPVRVYFSVSDADTDVNTLTLSATSSDQSILKNIADSGFTGGGAFPDVRLKPVFNSSGNTVVTITVSDGENRSSENFLLTVGQNGSATPTISEIDDVTTDFNTPVRVYFSVADTDTDVNALTFSATSSDQSILKNIADSGFTGAGSFPDVRLLPVFDSSGTTTVTITVSDGENQSSESFLLTVGQGGSATPTISEIDDVTTDFNTPVRVYFSVSDADTDVNALTLSATSSNQNILADIDDSGFTGSGAFPDVRLLPVFDSSGTTTVTITVSDGENQSSESFLLTVGQGGSATPTISEIDDVTTDLNTPVRVYFSVSDADTDVNALTLSATSSNQNILADIDDSGFTGSGAFPDVRLLPVFDSSGTTTVTITVSDGENQSSESFLLTVGQGGSATPTISEIDDVFTDLNTPVRVYFSVADTDTDVNSLVLSATSSDHNILADITDSEFTGSGAFPDVRLLPVFNSTGTTTVTITVSDGEHESSESFLLTVGQSSSARPTISEIDDVFTEVNTSVRVYFSIADADTDVNALTLSATSSNHNILADITDAEFTGSGALPDVSLSPVLDSSGTTTVTITVSDGENQSSESFLFTVLSENNVPTVTDIGDQSIVEDQDKTVNFTVGDVETAPDSLGLTVTSSNTNLLPISSISLGGSGANRTVKLDPIANLSGVSNIRITVDDGEYQDYTEFTVTVTEVNDQPTINSLDDLEMQPGATANQTISIADIETDANDLIVTAESDNTQVFANSQLLLSGNGASRTLTLNSSAEGQATITVTVKDAEGGQASSDFSVNVLESNPAYAQTGGEVADKPTQTVTRPVSNFTGAIAGSATVNGGQAGYSLPIRLVPGRNGMQPNVSLNYSSAAGNGIAGVGWSLSAGGGISRCAKTVVQDGQFSNPAFTTSDALCFNGERLILVFGNQGESGSQYRTELDQFALVSLKGSNTDSAASYFDVQYKDGRSARYGSSTNTSEVVLLGHTKTQTWLLEQESDIAAKNFIHYNYSTYGAAEVLLSSIDYTGTSRTANGDRHVVFSYNTTRADTREGYAYGGYWQSTALLDTITTQIGSAIKYTYHLDYRNSAASNRTLLASIRQCEVQGECHLPTTFDWQDSAFSYELERLNVNNSPVLTEKRKLKDAMPYGDINGDGAIDWPGYFIDADANGEAHNFVLDRCYKNTTNLKNHCISGDFNNDGLTDGWDISSGRVLQIKLTNGSIIPTDISMPLGPADSGIKDDHVADIRDYDGDGFADLIIYHFTGTEVQLNLYTHTGNLNAPYSTAAVETIYLHGISGSSPNRQLTTDISYIGDIDGNGLPDLVELDKYTTDSTYFAPIPRPNAMLRNNGGSFIYQLFDLGLQDGGSDLRFFSLFIDVNGDGLADWLGYTDSGSSDTKLALNLGDGNFAQPLAINMAFENRSYVEWVGDERTTRKYPKFASAMKVHDINMDGIAELLIPDEILLEACVEVSEVDTSTDSDTDIRTSTVTKCGAALYDAVKQVVGSNSTTPLPTDEIDKSVYQFKAYSFTTNEDGLVTATESNTDIVGAAYESAMVDAYGDGFVDLVSVIGINGDNNDCAAEDHYEYLKHSTASGLMAGRDCEYGVYVYRSRGSAESNERYAATDMLKRATNGVGAQANWDYKPLSSSAYVGAKGLKLYDVDNRDINDPDHFHFGSSMYVVREFSQSNGLGGTFDTRYAYRGAMFNNKGRGFRGFRTIVSEDVNNALVNQVDFRQKFPFSSRVQGEFVFESSKYAQVLDFHYDQAIIDNSEGAVADALSATVSVWDINQTHWDANNITACQLVWNSPSRLNDYVCDDGLHLYAVYQSSSETLTRDLKSAAIMSTSSSAITAIDAYSNVLSSESKVEDKVGNASDHATETQNTYTNDESEWFLGRLDLQVTTYKKVERASGDPLKTLAEGLDSDRTVTTRYDNYNKHRKPEDVSTSVSDSNRTLQTISDFNDYGFPMWVEQRGQVYVNGSWSEQIRRSSFTYTKNGTSVSAEGYFPYALTNALGHTTTTTTDITTGQPLSVTDANGVTVSTTYDGFGRAESVIAAGAPMQYLAYQGVSGDNYAPNYAAWKQVTVQMGSPQQTVYFDILDRPLRTAIANFAGNGAYFSDIEYNNRGLTAFESAPYENGNSRYGTKFTAYDSLGRLTGKTVDQVNTSLVTDYIHDAFTTTIKAGNLPNMTRTYNSLKQLVHTEDAQSGETRYAYDSQGNPIVIRDANNNDIQASYNGLGHKLYVDDPNMGRSNFINNSFGEVESEADANGDVLDYSYDTLGRVTLRTTHHAISSVPDSSAIFVWDDVESGCKKGLLCRESENGMSRAYQYDNFSRITETTTTLDGSNYVTTQHYDSNYGRPKALVYPNSLTVGFDYNTQGYLTEEYNAANNYVYRNVTAMDAFGNISGAEISDDKLTGTYLYSQKTGQMLSSVVEQGSSALHDLNYSNYDEFGNIEEQSNLVTGTSETFVYDNLQRLTTNVAKHNGATIQSVTYDYDAVGNFKYKSDYSTTASNAYQYGQNGAGPNAVSTVLKPTGSVSFGYDNKGNMTSGDDLSATFTAYGKPYTLTKNGVTSTFEYGSDLMRYKQVKGSDTTYYIDKLFEVEGNDWRAYISDVAVIKHSGNATDIRYLHRDRLGSAVTLTDHNGNAERRRFDPFGKSRGINSESLVPPRLSSFGTDVDITPRGFTDHEHLDEQELIHMNGRVYDYNLGRFMSVDPFIQSPTNSQSVNPYSYIMNNPLGGTDPTGYAIIETKINVPTSMSRIQKTVTVNTDSETGDTTITGGSSEARGVVARDIVNGYNASNTASTPTEIGSQQPKANARSEETTDSGVASAGNKSKETGSTDVSILPVVLGAAASSAGNVTEEAKNLQQEGKYKHADGTVKKSGFQGNQNDGYTAKDVKESKKVQIRKALGNRIAGTFGGAVTLYSVADDLGAHQEGTISTLRLIFRTTGNLAPWVIAGTSPWLAVGAGIVFPVTEHFYNEASQGFNNARQRENINSFTDFNKRFLNIFTGTYF